MPNRDNTGPAGQGPLTGRQMGTCSGGRSLGFGRNLGRRFSQSRRGLRSRNQNFAEIGIEQQNSEVSELRNEIDGLKSNMNSILEKLDQLGKN